MNSESPRFKKSIREFLDERDVADRLAAYEETYTGALWDRLIAQRSSGPAANEITVDDLLAPSLLSAPISAQTIAAFIDGEQSAEISALLTAIPHDLELWDDGDQVRNALYCAEELISWLASDAFPGTGWTKASKLLAAKRPRLIPIWDALVGEALGASTMNWPEYWNAWRSELTPEVMTRLDELTQKVGRPDRSPLRTADIIVWMAESTGGNSDASPKDADAEPQSGGLDERTI